MTQNQNPELDSAFSQAQQGDKSNKERGGTSDQDYPPSPYDYNGYNYDKETFTRLDTLIRKIAQVYIRNHLSRHVGSDRSVQFADLVQVGWVAVQRGFPNFDPRRGANLETFLSHRIYGAMQDYLRRLAPTSRTVRRRVKQLKQGSNSSIDQLSDSEIAASAGINSKSKGGSSITPAELRRLANIRHINIDTVRGSPSLAVNPNPEEQIYREEQRALLQEALKNAPGLTPRQKLVIELLLKGWSQAEIAKALHRHHTAINQTVGKALRNIQAYIQGRLSQSGSQKPKTQS